MVRKVFFLWGPKEKKETRFFLILIPTFSLISTRAVNNEVLSPPLNNNALLNHRDNLLITQPSSIPNSPLASPNAQSVSPTFCLQSSLSNVNLSQDHEDPTTADPNWQATKATIRERNAAMFNNDLMSDVRFLVGCDGELDT